VLNLPNSSKLLHNNIPLVKNTIEEKVHMEPSGAIYVLNPQNELNKVNIEPPRELKPDDVEVI
jgi:hypothetical protein